jgi:predicted transcriptional regulator YdeE
MTEYTLENDVPVIGAQVKTFPDGIGEAFDRLISMLPDGMHRPCYGICYGTEKGIHYIAAIAGSTSEAATLNLQSYIIPKGDYVVKSIANWRDKLPAIKEAFHELLSGDCADISRPCIEWYKNDNEMLCMLKLDPMKKMYEQRRVNSGAA